MAERGLLHLDKVDAFAAWLEARGWVREPTKGIYEVLRMRSPEAPAPMILFARDRSRHATTQGGTHRLVREFINETRLQ